MMFVHTKMHTSHCTVNTKDLNLIMKLKVFSCPCTAERAIDSQGNCFCNYATFTRIFKKKLTFFLNLT